MTGRASTGCTDLDAPYPGSGRSDALHSWRYRPDAAIPVDDPNNATDGDLFIAWACWRPVGAGAGRSMRRGAAIGRDMLRLLVRRAGTYSLLLPGAQGFERAGHVVNPSYYVFPAFPLLARAVPDAAWARVAADGLTVLRLAGSAAGDYRRTGCRSAGRWPLSRPTGWLPRFSFDAVRVPLWLAWAGLHGAGVARARVSGPSGAWLRHRPGSI